MSFNFYSELLRIADPGMDIDTMNHDVVIQEGQQLARIAVTRLAEEIAIDATLDYAAATNQDPNLYTALLLLTQREGKFTQDLIDYSPKGGEGYRCDRCLFWQGSGQCAIAQGNISPKGLCRFYLIPPPPVERTDGHDKTKYLMQWHGLKLGISHDPGDERHGRPMKAHYGCVWGSYGQAEDGMAIDVYVVPSATGAPVKSVFRVLQIVPATGELDESKYILGAADQKAAERVYLDHMPPQFFGGIEPSSLQKIAPIRKDAEPTKRVVRYQGLKIGVTHEPGDRRFALATPMGASYGRLFRSYGQGMDGKALDVYLREGFKGETTPIYQITQIKPSGEPDEHKLMVGYADVASAKADYCRHAGKERFGVITLVQPETLDAYRADSLWHQDGCGCDACDRRKRAEKRTALPPDDEEPERGLRRDGWVGQSLRTDADGGDVAQWLRTKAIKAAQPILKGWRAATLKWIQDQGSLESASFELKNNPQSLIKALRKSKTLETAIYQNMMLSTLSGREAVLDEGDDLRLDARRPGWVRQPFQEAVTHFRQKVTIPVEEYSQLTSDYHDWAFSIARMTQADWLEAARWLIDRALAEGFSFDQFEKQWNRLIGRKGWKPSNPRQLWTIFDTNIRGAIGAGRYQQMTDPVLLAQRPIWVWRWRDSPSPREEHEKLHMKGIYADHPFWKGLRVPAGYGCRCAIFAVSLDYAQRHGIAILTDPPDPKVIADPAFRVPFNGEAPYGGRDRKTFLDEKLKGYPSALRSVLTQDFQQLNLL